MVYLHCELGADPLSAVESSASSEEPLNCFLVACSAGALDLVRWLIEAKGLLPTQVYYTKTLLKFSRM